MHYRRPVSFPVVKSENISYTLRSISLAKEGCYDKNKRLLVDGGYGDYNMRLFRLRDKLRFVREIPSAFSSSIREALEYKPSDPREERIITQHNQQIDQILSQPKEVYLEKISKEKKLQEERQAEWNKAHQYIKGEDKQVRQYDQQLTFNYLTKNQAQKWFKIKDHSASYYPPKAAETNQAQFSTPKMKPRRRTKGHIFLSDDRNNRIFKRI